MTATTPRRARLAAVIAGMLLAPFVAACGSAGSAVGGAGTPSSSARLPADQLVLRISSVGGLVAPGVLLTALPAVSLYGDGRLLFPGPVTEQYPAHALPPVAEQRLTAGQVGRLLADAEAAGLDGVRRDYGAPRGADLPSTVFTAYVDGRTVTATVPGLADPRREAASDAPAAHRAARTRLAEFQAEVTALLDSTAQRRFRPAALAVFASPYRAAGAADTPVRAERRAWRGPDPAGGARLPGPGGADARRCLVVRGPALEAVRTTVEEATTLTRWSVGDRTWSLAFRPMLPDERSCADVVAAASTH